MEPLVTCHQQSCVLWILGSPQFFHFPLSTDYTHAPFASYMMFTNKDLEFCLFITKFLPATYLKHSKAVYLYFYKLYTYLYNRDHNNTSVFLNWFIYFYYFLKNN